MTGRRIVGFTGSRVLGPGDTATIVGGLRSVLDADGYVTGGAIGADAYIGEWLAAARPATWHRVIVPGNTTQVLTWWRGVLAVRVEVIRMSPDSTYADRNAAIVAASTELVAFPMWPEEHRQSVRSGTWQTVRMARRAGLPVTVHPLAPNRKRAP